MVTLSQALKPRPLILDGGLGALLESRGYPTDGPLWSARVLAESPEAITQAHRDYFDAGARLAISATYQLSYEGGHKAGLDDAQVEDFARQSVELARQAGDPGALILTSVGPYGAMLANGSEYHGDYGVSTSELTAWHRRRLKMLIEAGGDGLAIETIPSLQEVEAITQALADFDVQAWLSITPEHGTSRTREPLAQVFELAASIDQIVAVGVNCCHPQEVLGAAQAAQSVTDKPFVAYPNSGGHWDVKRQEWFMDGGFPIEAVPVWAEAGIAAIGGCCRVSPEDIAQIRRQVG